MPRVVTGSTERGLPPPWAQHWLRECSREDLCARRVQQGRSCVEWDPRQHQQGEARQPGTGSTDSKNSDTL